MVALAVITVVTTVSCKRMMSPLARAFGCPPESELAVCRVTFARLQQYPPSTRIAVAPVFFVEDHTRTWRIDLAQSIAQNIGPRLSARLGFADAAPAVAPRDLGRNQLNYLWQRASDYTHWIKRMPPDTDFVLCAEVWSHGGQVDAIHLYVFDATGQVAYCRLFNSHHFGNNLPAAGTDAIDFMVKRFLADLSRSPTDIFPPYGVG